MASRTGVQDLTGASDCVCGTSSATLAFRYAKLGCPIVACPDCGTAQALPGGFDPHSYYSGDYFDGTHRDGYADYAGSEAVLRSEFRRTVDFLRGFVPAGTLLEIGCAYGFFLQEAKAHYRIHGVEISDAAVDHCRSAGLTCVRSGTLTPQSIESIGSLDALVMLDVIEHLGSPKDVLRTAAAALRPGGVALITTGDYSSRYAKLAGKRWRLMTPPQHLWFLTPRGIEALAESTGLEVVSIDHPWKFVPLSLVEYQVRRMLGLCQGATRLSSRLSVPINLFDAMRIVLRRPLSS